MRSCYESNFVSLHEIFQTKKEIGYKFRLLWLVVIIGRKLEQSNDCKERPVL